MVALCYVTTQNGGVVMRQYKMVEFGYKSTVNGGFMLQINTK